MALMGVQALLGLLDLLAQPGPQDLLVLQALLERMVLLGLQVVVRLPVVLMVISTSIQVMIKSTREHPALGQK